MSFDVSDDLEATLGLDFLTRGVGWGFGFGLGFNGVWSGTGEAQCESQIDWKGKPCKNVDKGISESIKFIEQFDLSSE